jgi:3-hydroxyacyl-CoA dehydrogenase
MVADGRAGVKSGRGFYDYGERLLTSIETDRDRKYLVNYRNLVAINAFERI